MANHLKNRLSDLVSALITKMNALYVSISGKADRNGANATGTWNGAAKTVEGTNLGRVASTNLNSVVLATAAAWHNLPAGIVLPVHSSSAGCAPGGWNTVFKYGIQDSGGRSFYVAKGSPFIGPDDIYFGMGTATKEPEWVKMASVDYVNSRGFITSEDDPVWTAARPNTITWKGSNPNSSTFALESGIYYITPSSPGTNLPPSVGNVTVSRTTNGMYHALWTGQYGVNNSNPMIAWGWNSGESGWKSIALLDDIPTVNNGTLTIAKENGQVLGTFSANQSGNTTINVPNDDNELENNDYGYGQSILYSGWDTKGGFAAKSVHVELDPNDIYSVKEDEYSIVLELLNPGSYGLELPEANDFPHRIIRIAVLGALGNSAVLNIATSAITSISGTSISAITTRKYIVIQSVPNTDDPDVCNWYQIGGNM